MPKFYVARYTDNTYHLVWSFRSLTHSDICTTCWCIYKLTFWQYITWYWRGIIKDKMLWEKCYIK